MTDISPLLRSASAYLRQWASQPVDWRMWGPGALDAAQAQGKPIFLSIGSTACHWCARMDRESFDDPAIAAQLNADFICIKVDKEDRPEIDALYQAAMIGLSQPGGWPLSMFCLPDGRPFWGGCYFPPRDVTQADGTRQAGLPNILAQITDAMNTRRESIESSAQSLASAVATIMTSRDSGDLRPEALEPVAATFMSRIDLQHGGITGSSKFPTMPYFMAVWRAYQRTGKADYAAAVQLTMTMMCQGTLYDHLSGGFFRYCADNEWRVPQFEKAVADNALILEGLCHLHGNIPQPLYAQRIAQTVDWLVSEMSLDQGGFAAASAAGADAQDDGHYLWQRGQILAALGSDLGAAFCETYGLDGETAFDAHYALHRLDALEIGAPDAEARWAAACEKLRQVRAQRPNPARDASCITAVNGHVICAITHAAQLLQRKDWLERADDAFKAVFKSHMVGGDLLHAVDASQTNPPLAGPPALVEDYAALGRAALALAQAKDDPAYLAPAQQLADQMLSLFQTDSGAFSQSTEATPLGQAIPIHDQPLPSGNAQAIAFLTQLSQLSGAARYEDAALAAVAALGGEPQKNPLALGGFLAAFEDLIDPMFVTWDTSEQDGFAAETIAWAVHPPGCLMLGPNLQAAKGLTRVSGISIIKDGARSPAISDREAAIDALRNARRIATSPATGSIS